MERNETKMDLIDRASLLVSFEQKCAKNCLSCYRAGWRFHCGLILNAPAVDAVAVVRCADCANAYMAKRETRTTTGKITKTELLRCRKWGRYTAPDGFCDKGIKGGIADATD